MKFSLKRTLLHEKFMKRLSKRKRMLNCLTANSYEQEHRARTTQSLRLSSSSPCQQKTGLGYKRVRVFTLAYISSLA